MSIIELIFGKSYIEEVKEKVFQLYLNSKITENEYKEALYEIHLNDI